MTPLEWILFVTAPTVIFLFGLEINFLSNSDK